MPQRGMAAGPLFQLAFVPSPDRPW